MSLLLTLLFLTVMATENAGAAVRPIVNFSSNWATIFTSESVTMTCNVDSTAQGDLGYSWYKDGSLIGSGQQKYTIVTAKESHRGEYKCKTHDSDLSEAAKLTVSHGYLALKVPPFVFEGDILELSCAAYPGYSAGDAELHKGDQSIGSSHSGNFNIGRVNMKTSGSYTCSRSVKHHLIYYGQKSSVYISVKELFSKPIISGNSGQIQINEGGHMTITCDTKLSPHRATTELQFAFYRNGHNVQGFSLSNQYGVPSAQLEDSANYTCEIKAQSGGVKKESDPKSIQIKELFPKPVIQVNLNHLTEGDHMTITCDTKLSPHRETTELQFVFYRNGHNVQGFSLSNQYGVPSAQLEDSGNYTCEVQTPTGSVRKRSNVTHIHIQELFPYPLIKAISDQVTEGDHMTITCDTKLSPHRATTELQFVFYRNGHNVQGFSLSKQYGVPSAQMEDSGKYTCEVQTPTGSVRKRSDNINIQVTDNTTLMLIIVVTVALAVLISLFIIAFLILKSKKNQHRRQSSQRKTLSGPGETNLDEDVCYMSINFNRQPKAHSTSQNNDDGDNVIYAAVKGSDRRNTQAAYKQVQRENSVVYAALKTPGGNKNNQELRTIPQDENCVYASVKKR
ncbi:high affinity immunoglobulin gamma Fc receptor I-like isoform X4 [Xenopus laevis]|uniref:high affinity immunoglobulin gamma Fc receptor I-like isoform X4 n=1 Tax=Xenopus laevis TaxID=8355 RepID=UPI001BB10D76|nr:high affinity immunoglobulin gamma Fc receptor I-like isoform X4 [Xenopus laevis]